MYKGHCLLLIARRLPAQPSRHSITSGTEPCLQILITIGILHVTSKASYRLHVTRKSES